MAAGAPGPLRKAVGDVEGGAAHHEQHAERHQERRDLEPGHEPAIDEADQEGRDHRDHEGDPERGGAAVEERPHQHRREAEDRADREVELAGRHQQRHGQRHEADLDREDQRVADVARRQEVGVDRPEDQELHDQEHEGPQLGPGDQAPYRRRSFHR